MTAAAATASTVTATVDLSKVDANLARYTAMAGRAGAGLRAHVKGHRVPEITALQLAAGAVGVSVHSAAEGRAHGLAGARSIVIAWPWRDPWRWIRFAELARDFDVCVHVDDPASVKGIAAAARQAGARLGVRIEVDTGLHRTGVAPEGAVALAKAVAAEADLRLDGVTGYAAITTAEQAARRVQLGREQARLLVAVAGELAAAGLPCPVVSVGGTPTLAGALGVAGVTEVCCGAYALLDSGLAALGVCSLDDVAISVPAQGAQDLLAGGDQVWQPSVVMSPPRGQEVLPAHVCPLVAKRPSLRVLRDNVFVAQWRALVEPDRR